MQKTTAITIVLGALILACALTYHGRQLAALAEQMGALEKRTGGLDNRLEAFSKELPSLIEQAGRDAGRQAVHGVIEEAIQKPLKRAASTLAHTAGPVATQVTDPHDPNKLFPRGGASWIRFDIPDPVVNIEIITDIEDPRSLPWLSRTHGSRPAAETQHPGNERHDPIPIEGKDPDEK